LCPKFSNFLADKDQLLEANNPENIENLIDHFDPSNLSFPTSISHEVVNDSEDVKFSKYSYNLLILPIFYEYTLNNTINI
jgi:hypothetical protein